MEERTYTVLENGHILATGMKLDIALLLMKAYSEEYYEMRTDLTLVREVDTVPRGTI